MPVAAESDSRVSMSPRRDRPSYHLPRIWLLVVGLVMGKTLLLLSGLAAFPLAVFGTVFGLFLTVPIAAGAFLFHGRRGHEWYLFLFNLAVSVIFLVDAVYIRAFGYPMSARMLVPGEVAHDGMWESVFSLLRWTDVLFLIDLPFLVLVLRSAALRPARGRRLGTFAFLSLISALTVLIQFSTVQIGSHLSDRRMTPLRISPLGAHALDLWDIANSGHRELTAEERAEVAGWLDANAKYQTPDSTFEQLAGVLRGRNVVVIQFESLENVVIGLRVQGQEVTPHLNRLVSTSFYFSNVVEQVRDGSTADAELMFNTSMYPLSNGAAFLGFPFNAYASLPSLLCQDGYSTVALHGGAKEFWNRDSVVPALGYQRYLSGEQFADRRSSGLGVLDESLFAEALGQARSTTGLFFFYVITVTSHVPFKIPPEKRGLVGLSPDDPASEYLQSIHYTDAALGRFLRGLAESGLDQDTAVVVYGDHEGVHRFYETALQDNASEVPLIIHIPGVAGRPMAIQGGQVDLMPTLAFLLGLDSASYQDKVMGRNLFGRYSGSGIHGSGAVLSGVDDTGHLADAQRISDLIIRSDYFDGSLKPTESPSSGCSTSK